MIKPELLEAHSSASRTHPFPLLVKGALLLLHLDATMLAEHGLLFALFFMGGESWGIGDTCDPDKSVVRCSEEHRLNALLLGFCR